MCPEHTDEVFVDDRTISKKFLFFMQPFQRLSIENMR